MAKPASSLILAAVAALSLIYSWTVKDSFDRAMQKQNTEAAQKNAKEATVISLIPYATSSVPAERIAAFAVLKKIEVPLASDLLEACVANAPDEASERAAVKALAEKSDYFDARGLASVVKSQDAFVRESIGSTEKRAASQLEFAIANARNYMKLKVYFMAADSFYVVHDSIIPLPGKEAALRLAKVLYESKDFEGSARAYLEAVGQ